MPEQTDMAIMKILADYKIKAAKRRAQEAAFWNKVYGREEVYTEEMVSTVLAQVRNESEQSADELVLRFLFNPKKVKHWLVKADVATISRVLLEQNCDLPDAFERPLSGLRTSDYSARGFELLLKERLLAVLTTDLELAKFKHRNKRSFYTPPNGLKCNPEYRSLYLQLNGIARRREWLLCAVTVKLKRDVWGINFNTKASTSIKNALRRILAKVAGEMNKYAAYSYECSNEGTYHLHGLIVMDGRKIPQLRTELRRIADSAPNSVLVKEDTAVKRLMSENEHQQYSASKSSGLVEYDSPVTRGFADYISKDLGKPLGDGSVKSSIVTINPGRDSDDDYTAYSRARSDIITICARRIETTFKSIGPDELVSHLIKELPVLQTLIALMSNTGRLHNAA